MKASKKKKNILKKKEGVNMKRLKKTFEEIHKMYFHRPERENPGWVYYKQTLDYPDVRGKYNYTYSECMRECFELCITIANNLDDAAKQISSKRRACHHCGYPEGFQCPSEHLSPSKEASL